MAYRYERISRNVEVFENEAGVFTKKNGAVYHWEFRLFDDVVELMFQQLRKGESREYDLGV